MTDDFSRNLDKYAEVILKIGLNLQPGQRLLIGRPGSGLYGTPIELAPLVRRIATQAYQMGAPLVEVLWNDDHLRLIRFQHAPPETLDEFPAWRAQTVIEAAEAGDAVLRISAQDPDLMAEQDPGHVAMFNSTIVRHMERFSEMLSRSATNWLVVTAPVEGWTEKLFADLPPDEARARFWDVLFQICRIDQADPVAAWMDHVAELLARGRYLNRKQYAGLRLIGPGTDLKLGLPRRHIWSGARMKSENGIDFTANVPTEEIFTTPHAAMTEGVVTTSKPFSYGGAAIEGLRMTFSRGYMTEMSATKGESYLKGVLSVDEGARRLGEVALVPHSSPISRLGMLFHNTLIDENAASHLALGRGFRFAIEGAGSMSDEEFEAVGGNQSLIHIDCMVGSGEMDVDGLTAGGDSEPIMRAGEWAFDI
jgi:aminopeptidase